MNDTATTDRTTIDWNAAYATRAARMGGSEIRELLKVLEQPGMLSFAGGIPDPALFPAAAAQEASTAILSDPKLGAQALQYSASEGYKPLREWLVHHMGTLGVPCAVDNIVITGGSQQGLDFLGKLLISAGDTMLVTAPTYLGALQAFNAYEPRYDRLDLAGNMTPAGYREAAAPGRVAAAYAVPDFANPTGESITEASRLALLDLAAGLDVPLIEDAAYSSLRFEGEAIPSCLALDVARSGGIERSRVIYCGTFSKTISPGLRVGWICAASPLVQKVVLTKQAADLHSPTLSQMVIHRIATAEYDQIVQRNITAYGARRDAMLNALQAHMPPGVSWTRPKGGMFVWVTLPDGMNGADILKLALAEEKIAFVPGGAFYADSNGQNTLRLAYSLQPEAVIEEGMRRLGRLLTREIAKKNGGR